VWGAVESGRVDGCVFARWFVSNPDLVERYVFICQLCGTRLMVAG
jgi:hypothetical protein